MKNILIVGGELRNRGAQAMTFHTVAALKKLFPDHEMVLASTLDARQPFIKTIRGSRTRADLDNLSFRIVWDETYNFFDSSASKELGAMLSSGKNSIRNLMYASKIKEYSEVIKNTSLCVDISGFAFGAQWGYENCQYYLSKISTLHKLGIPTYILPQSFGPFAFEDAVQTDALKERAAEVLQYPRIICAREMQGYQDVMELCPKARCIIAEDIVLSGSDIDPSDVFDNPALIASYKGIETSKNVGIIPNVRTFEHSDKVLLLALYGSIVEMLLDDGYHVYIIRHAEDDEPICRQIKGMFPEDNRVVLRNEDRYCFQYEELFERCDFLIASRFHSIVHAYRCAVPCVALGWSTKYSELLGRFGQDRFVHDIQNLDDDIIKSVFNSIYDIISSYKEESENIGVIRREMQSGPSIFDRVLEDYREMYGAC